MSEEVKQKEGSETQESESTSAPAAKSVSTSQDLPDPEVVAQFVQVVPTVDIVRAVYEAIGKAQQHRRENWRKHPPDPV